MELNYYYRSGLFNTRHLVLAVMFRKGAGAAMFAKIFLRNFLILWREPKQLCQKLLGQLLTKSRDPYRNFRMLLKLIVNCFAIFENKGTIVPLFVSYLYLILSYVSYLI